MDIVKWHEDLAWPIDLDETLFWDINGVIDPMSADMVYLNYNQFLMLKNMTPENAYQTWINRGGKI